MARRKATAPADMRDPANWPAGMQELARPLASVTPYPRNPRSHPPDQIEFLSKLLLTYGPDQPIVDDEDGVIIKGHGRREAALLAGFEVFPVTRRTGMSDADKMALRIADNQSSLLATWDKTLLKGEVGVLHAQNYNFKLLGFDDIQLRDLGLSISTPQNDPEHAPEPSAKPIVRFGDLWVLGEHRLLCGDSTQGDDVAKVLAGARPHLMVTDPPYGVNYDADWRNHTGDLGRSARAVGKVLNDDRADWRDAWAFFSGDVAYVWHAATKAHIVAESLIVCGFEIRAQVVWAKSQLVISRGHYHPQHEPMLYAVRKSRAGHWAGDRKQTTLWQIDKPQKSETGHSTQKPVECMKRPIENNSRRGDFVYDPFGGSGTTIIACELTGRRGLLIEIHPAYVQVTIERWEKVSGKRATLDGQTLAEVAAARRKGKARAPARASRHRHRAKDQAPA